MSQMTDLSRQIWEAKYRYREESVEESWARMAKALSGTEKDREWEKKFLSALEDFAFLPGGRIQAGAGTKRQVTLFNCFVMGKIDDSMDGIFEALKEGALTMQQGGGIGYDFSSLRPSGSKASGVGVTASGPVSFMKIWDSMCATILSIGARRGAMMATLSVGHPDIETFIEAKRNPAELRHFNLSVLISDRFMQALKQDESWELSFGGKTHKTVKARDLWEKIMQAAFDSAEPGVIFIDRVNRQNNLYYGESLAATNPCGEIPLPYYGACNLGSINLTRFVTSPFEKKAAVDFDKIGQTAAIAVRMLDNVYDVSHFPLQQQKDKALLSRRIGLGITGLADCFIMLGMKYGEPDSLRLAHEIMQTISHSAYRCSIELACEKAPFPLFNREKYLAGEFVKSLPADIRQKIGRHGIRNSHLTAIAPAGTISLLAGNVSSGLEPVHSFEACRKIRQADGSIQAFQTSDYAFRLFNEENPGSPLPDFFVTASDIGADAQIEIQSCLQNHVDNAISKTVSVPESCDFKSFCRIYDKAYDSGLKGCTAFRPNTVTGEIFLDEERHCCSVEREAD